VWFQPDITALANFGRIDVLNRHCEWEFRQRHGVLNGKDVIGDSTIDSVFASISRTIYSSPRNTNKEE
jgi:hypothetical protein